MWARISDLSVVAWLFPGTWAGAIAAVLALLTPLIGALSRVAPIYWLPLALAVALLASALIQAATSLIGHFRKPTSDSSAPHRLSLFSLYKIARDTLDWDFSGRSMDPLDLEIGLRQAGADGSIHFWGRQAPPHTSDRILDQYPLVKILPQHFEKYNLYGAAVAFVAAPPSDTHLNRETKTFVFSSDGGAYIDLHVDRDEAIKWLQHAANSFRGTTDRARSKGQ